jgi:hypothetical protein
MELVMMLSIHVFDDVERWLDINESALMIMTMDGG